MKTISDRQQTIFDLKEYEGSDSGMWGWLESDSTEELGTKNKNLVPNRPSLTAEALGTKNKNLVPNRPSLTAEELGTKNKNLVPNPPSLTAEELGTKNKNLVPNPPEIWKPPIGCLNRKWVKVDWYWYWSYYKTERKKTSLYLGKDYNKAISKAQRIGIPSNAKPSKIRAPAPEN